jgi:methionine sulfoxide reductase heme-binding subunit
MKNKYVVLVKVLLHLLCLVPLVRLGLGWYGNELGANPIEVVTRSTGTWTLVFLLVTLSVTPLRKLPKLYWLIRLRRMLGLYAFFYCCLHLTTYLWLDRYYEWEIVALESPRSFLSLIAEDIAKRPFITVGFAGFALLVPLALTSFKAAIKLLTGKWWQRLHRLVYVSAVCGVVHYFWLVKADLTGPLIYAGVLAFLLAVRVALKVASRRRGRVAAGAGRKAREEAEAVS